MKNKDIVYLVNRGVLEATSHHLSPSSAYLFYRFRKSINKAFNNIVESEKGLLNEVGVELEPEAFNARITALRNNPSRTTAEESEMQEMMKQSVAYTNMRNLLYAEDTPLADITPLPYDEWRVLQSENQCVTLDNSQVDVFVGYAEELLEGVLWSVPE